MLSGFGRFRRVTPLVGESLLVLMQRTSEKALEWRPPGRPPSVDELLIQSKEKGRYLPEWREETNE
eukprot:3513241-Prymnesium_polylepis.3